MRVEIFKGKAKGTVVAPPSKSMAHRNLICAALSEKSQLSSVAFSEDILATIDCLKELGASIEKRGDKVILGGLEPTAAKEAVLNCGESGSTLRFLLPLCLLCDREITLVGSTRLMQRPMTVYREIFEEKGISFYQDDKCIKVKGKLVGGEFKVDGSVSSQFISGLLFALPLLKQDSVIKIEGELQSQSYLKLTLWSLKAFGIRIDSSDIRSIKVFGGQHYESKNMIVEGDYSNSAFFSAFNFLGGDVDIKGLDAHSLQGDKVYLDIMPKLYQEKTVVSLADCPDLGPILFALASTGKGAIFTDTARLRIKESDRVECMEKELKKFGVKMDVQENCVIIHPGELHTPTEHLYGHNDHRIVMAVSVLATLTGGIIDGAQAVAKSFPDFFERLEEVGIKVKKYEA